MPTYRMYFRVSGEIHGREDFEAAHNVAAIRIASVLYDLWQGARRLRARQPRDQKANLDELVKALQNVLRRGSAFVKAAG
jgi:hypothetical protein